MLDHTIMETQRLTLEPLAPEQIRLLQQSAERFEQRYGRRVANGLREFLVSDELSPEYLAKLQSAQAADPWEFGFVVVHKADSLLMGMGGFKGRPDAQGMVEIGYGIAPDYQGKGYATEVAKALVNYAFENGRARVVRAHTLPEVNASTRVLEKCGFARLGPVSDPEDGTVWRWELECVST